MAQIPGVPNLGAVDKPMMNPRLADRSGMALADMGQDIEGMGLTELGIQAHIREAQKSVDQLAAHNQLNAAVIQYQDQLAKTSNSRQVPELATQAHDQLNDIAKQWGKSPAAAEIGMAADSLRPRLDHLSEVRGIDLMGKEWEAQATTQIQSLMPDIVAAKRSGDTAQEKQINDHIASIYDDAIQKGLKTTADKELAMNALQISIRKQVNEAAITSANPAERKQAIQQAAKGGAGPLDLTDMTEGERNILHNHAVEMDKHLTAQGEAQNVNGALNIAHDVFSTPEYKNPDGSPNYEAMQNALEGNDFYTKNGIVDANGKPDRVMGEQIMRSVDRQRTHSTQADADRNKKSIDDLDPYVENGKISFNELNRRSLLPHDDEKWISRPVADFLLSKAARIDRENRVMNMQQLSMMRQEAMDKSADIARDLLSDPAYLVQESDLTPYMLKGLSKSDANTVWQNKAITKDPAWHMALSMFNSSSLYDTTTDEGKAKLARDTIQFARTVQNKKLSGSQITDELQKELHPQEEAQKTKTVKTMLDNIWPIARSMITNQPVYGLNLPPAQPQAPTSRKEYFDGMKKANPNASDSEINTYLDGKGIK